MADTTEQPDLPDRYTKEDYRRRFLYLCERCETFIDAHNTGNPTWRLNYDPLVMIDVVKSFMDDIWRYKAYHLEPGKRSDCVKRSAYMTKWITRLRPIYFRRNYEKIKIDFDKHDRSLVMNEGFAIYVSLATIASELKKDTILLEGEFLADLTYDLHYRYMTGDALMHVYATIKRLVSKKSPILKIL